MFAVFDLSCNSGLYLLLDTLNDWLIDWMKVTNNIRESPRILPGFKGEV